jgi:hypothetical protein
MRSYLSARSPRVRKRHGRWPPKRPLKLSRGATAIRACSSAGRARASAWRPTRFRAFARLCTRTRVTGAMTPPTSCSGWPSTGSVPPTRRPGRGIRRPACRRPRHPSTRRNGEYKRWCAVLGLNQHGRPTYLRSSRPMWPSPWGPSGDHTLSAIVNDLRVCERYARPPCKPADCVCPGKTCYRYLLGVKWSWFRELRWRCCGSRELGRDSSGWHGMRMATGVQFVGVRHCSPIGGNRS